MSTVKHTNKPFLWRLPPAERRVVLILGDLLVSGLALLISLYFWGARDNWLDFSLAFLRERPPYWFYLLPVGWLLLLVELYDLRRAGRRKDTLAGVALAALAGLGVYLLIFFLSAKGSLPRFSVAVFIIAEAVLTLVWRFTYISVFSAPQFLRRVLIVGAGRAGTAALLLPPPALPLRHPSGDGGVPRPRRPGAGGPAPVADTASIAGAGEVNAVKP